MQEQLKCEITNWSIKYEISITRIYLLVWLFNHHNPNRFHYHPAHPRHNLNHHKNIRPGHPVYHNFRLMIRIITISVFMFLFIILCISLESLTWASPLLSMFSLLSSPWASPLLTMFSLLSSFIRLGGWKDNTYNWIGVTIAFYWVFIPRLIWYASIL